jgi:hypothetical protein
MLATFLTLVGTPSSGSASDNTCIWIDLYLLNPSIDKPIVHLTVVVPQRTTLRKILFSVEKISIFDTLVQWELTD